MWCVAWDLINAIDNQHLGVKSKASSIVNLLNITPIKFCCTKLGTPRSYVVSCEFLIFPLFIRNYGMVKESIKLREDHVWKQKQTFTEKHMEILEIASAHYQHRWNSIMCDRGKKCAPLSTQPS